MTNMTAPNFALRGQLETLLSWSSEARYDAGFTNTTSMGRKLSSLVELVGRIDDVIVAFARQGGHGTFPPALLSLRGRAANPDANLPAVEVRDVVTCAIMDLDQELALPPVQPSAFDIARKEVVRALETVRAASTGGWVELLLALQLFRQLDFIGAFVPFPPAYEQSLLALAKAKERRSDVAERMLEAGLVALFRAILLAQPTDL